MKMKQSNPVDRHDHTEEDTARERRFRLRLRLLDLLMLVMFGLAGASMAENAVIGFAVGAGIYALIVLAGKLNKRMTRNFKLGPPDKE